ncbi:MAG: hypothetical protein C0490_20500, partial [Marivirga sp.]|nr:hypothetical protein [Marivirga sp.]
MRLLFLAILLTVSSPLFGQGKTYSFIFLNKKMDADSLPKEQIDKIMEGHMANINRLAAEGKLISAGPFEGGGGIFILNTTSVDTAKRWLSTDPGVAANRWNIEILPYKPRIGSACAVSAPYEMVMYQFVRYKKPMTPSTARSYAKRFYKHDKLLKQLAKGGNVVTEGIFGVYDGGILVLKSEIEKEVLEADPAVQEGLLELEIKQ